MSTPRSCNGLTDKGCIHPVATGDVDYRKRPDRDSGAIFCYRFFTMDMEQRQSGLVVPKQNPKPPERFYGPMEIHDEERREMAKAGLSKLWDAMDLSRGGGGIRLPGTPGIEAAEAYYQVYCFVGEMLLGKDCPGKEVLT